MVSLAGDDAVFCWRYILCCLLQSAHLRVRRCPFWVSVFPILWCSPLWLLFGWFWKIKGC